MTRRISSPVVPTSATVSTSAMAPARARLRATVATLALTLGLAACGGAAGADGADGPSPAPMSSTPEVAPTSLTAGAFTAEQAEIGQRVFGISCAECHGIRDVRGASFMFDWEGSSVGRLYRVISTTMPDDDPGSLPDEEYAAVVAYILELNGFPAGAVELPSDMATLNELRIER